ncbi:unnamed protein product [Hyaloperonospora brassicae]|uniref:Uncharacterized protein n=1 Tax=Hyaloperonospora brassicae TaxID=162125 RepID=A0AAV0UV91_HYABA|nr:unnamed protein product [Hyaloperonospora brassicae]
MSSTASAARVPSVAPAVVPDAARFVREFPPHAPEDDFAQALEKQYLCKKLRAACTQLGLNPQADPSMNHKKGYIQLLTQYRRARQRGDAVSVVLSLLPTKRTAVRMGRGSWTRHCGFRLINVLFSRAFVGRIHESGALFLLQEGDEKVVDGRAKYWKDVAVAYTSYAAERHRILGPPGRYDGIDLALALQHTAGNLCSIWKDITARYKACLARWKQLETPDVGFAQFCGNLDVMYLYEKLQLQLSRVGSPEKPRPSKRVRTGDAVEDRGKGPANAAVDRTDERGAVLVPSERDQAPIRSPVARTADKRGPMCHRLDPASSSRPASLSRQQGTLASSEEQHTNWNAETLTEAMQEVVRVDDERRLSRLDTYDGVIYSSQAVRDTMSAIEALKRGSFDRTVIAQAEESMEAIVQVWLRELTKARQQS